VTAPALDSLMLTEEAEEAAATLLTALGMDIGADTERTPHRMVKALAELTANLRTPFDPAATLARTFDPPAPGYTAMIIARDVAFTSVCEHHVLPFTGHATVAYVPQPGARIVGLSKLARLVTGYAARPQMQERLGEQVTAAIMTHLDAQGAGCVLSAVHTCLTLRGPRSSTASMTSSHLAGRFFEPEMRAEFLALIANGRPS
jgi:GTP cyclohydrolase I